MNWLMRANWTLLALGVGLLLLTAIVAIWPNDELIITPTDTQTLALPARPFEQDQAAYDTLANTVFAQEFSAPSMQLPDLKRHLTYYGPNKRPDSQAAEQQWLHIALRGSGGKREIKSVEPGQPTYLVYQKSGRTGNYNFSPDNAETGLWIEVTQNPGSKEAQVIVSMRDQNEEIVTRPEEYRELTLTERPVPRYGAGKWELDGQRVDGSLLSRQRARWYGADQFLIDHGGDAYAAAAAKQRVSFGKDQDLYFLRVAVGDNLVWKEGKWEPVTSAEQSLGYPLLHVVSAQERTLECEIWDVEGKGKVTARITRGTPRWQLRFIQREVRFAGARTRSRLNLDMGTERAVVQPNDWIVLLDNDEWQRIDTVERLEAFLSDRLLGQLLVIDGVDKEDGQQVLRAHVYDSGRTARKNITFRSSEPYVVIEGTPTPTIATPKKDTVQEDAPDDEGAEDEEEEKVDAEPTLPFELPDEVNPEEIRKRWEEFRKERGGQSSPPFNMEELRRGFRGREGMRWREQGPQGNSNEDPVEFRIKVAPLTRKKNV